MERFPFFHTVAGSVVVGVGRFHDAVVCPVGVAEIAEAAQCISSVDERFIRHAAQHAVGDRRHFRTGDGVLRTESAVFVAADPAILDAADDHIIEPVPCMDIAIAVNSARVIGASGRKVPSS